MAYTTLNSLLTAIANAIRSKKGTTAQINAQNFPSEIASIKTGKEIIYIYNNGIENENYPLNISNATKNQNDITISGYGGFVAFNASTLTNYYIYYLIQTETCNFAIDGDGHTIFNWDDERSKNYLAIFGLQNNYNTLKLLGNYQGRNITLKEIYAIKK